MAKVTSTLVANRGRAIDADNRSGERLHALDDDGAIDLAHDPAQLSRKRGGISGRSQHDVHGATDAARRRSLHEIHFGLRLTIVAVLEHRADDADNLSDDVLGRIQPGKAASDDRSGCCTGQIAARELLADDHRSPAG
jgi:hypothetical protein